MERVLLKHKPKKIKTGFLITKTIVFILFVLYAISLIYSILWAFLASLKEQVEYMTNNRNGFPEKWLFYNYVRASKMLSAGESNMFKMLFNSLWYSVGGSVLGVIVSSMVAYVVAKYSFPGRGFIYKVSLLTLMIPVIGAMPSQYKIYNMLGILNSPLLIVSFAGGFGFNFIVMHSFFKSLPWSLAEAGFIDGAGNLRVFVKIMAPQAVGVIVALALVSGINLWNDYMGPLLFLKDYPTLSAGMYIFQVENTRNLNMPLLFAGVLMSMVPVLILFIAFQNTIMDMTISGGLKG